MTGGADIDTTSIRHNVSGDGRFNNGSQHTCIIKGHIVIIEHIQQETNLMVYI